MTLTEKEKQTIKSLNEMHAHFRKRKPPILFVSRELYEQLAKYIKK